MSLQSWRAALSEIPNLIADEPNRENALLLAALMVLEPRFATHEEITQPQPEISAQDESEAGTSDIQGHINDELSDSEMYYNLWVQTKDPEYKQFASDELRHAEFWIKQAQQNGIPQSELQNYATWHHSILAKLA